MTAARAAHAWIAVMLTAPFRHARRNMHPDTAALIDNTIRGHNAAADGHPAPGAAGIVPEHGDMFDLWLRQQRDRHTGDAYTALDTALTEYRHTAKAAVPLVRITTPAREPCTWYNGDPIADVPDDYNGPCLDCGSRRDKHPE